MTTFTDNEPFTTIATIGGSGLTGTVTFSGANQTLCDNVTFAADGTATCAKSPLVAPAGYLTYPYTLLATCSDDLTNASNQSNGLDIALLSATDVLFCNDFEPSSASCPIE